jgi:hypothetical protein
MRHDGSKHLGNRVRLAGVAGVGVAGLILGLPGVTSAAEPAPTLFWTVTPPTLGQTHSPNPVDGTAGVSTQLQLELATNNDVANNPAPTGTVTFSDSMGIVTGNCNNEPAQPQNLDASYAFCTVTFPAGTTGNDVITASYSGDSKNGPTSGTQTINFGPADATPEIAWPDLLPLAALALGGGAVVVTRRRAKNQIS